MLEGGVRIVIVPKLPPVMLEGVEPRVAVLAHESVGHIHVHRRAGDPKASRGEIAEPPGGHLLLAASQRLLLVGASADAPPQTHGQGACEKL